MKKKKKKAKYNVNAAIRSALRRAFARHPAVAECMRRVRKEVPKLKNDGTLAKKPSVFYLCNVCMDYVGSTWVEVDHITPVVSADGTFVDWNEFIGRLFCDADNLQVICKDCHKCKTQEERILRLRKLYSAQLDEIELDLMQATSPKEFLEIVQDLLRYTSKDKVQGLEAIAERASGLSELITRTMLAN